MSRIVSRTRRSTMAGVRSASVVISPATTARSVVTMVSQATRLVGSAARQWSRMASLIWSATLSGWPIDTDSLVKRYRSVLTRGVLVPRAMFDSGNAGSLGKDYKRFGRRRTISTSAHRANERLEIGHRRPAIDAVVEVDD